MIKTSIPDYNPQPVRYNETKWSRIETETAIDLDTVETTFRLFIIRHNADHNGPWARLSEQEREALAALHWRQFRAELLSRHEGVEPVGL